MDARVQFGVLVSLHARIRTCKSTPIKCMFPAETFAHSISPSFPSDCAYAFQKDGEAEFVTFVTNLFAFYAIYVEAY